MRMVVIRITVVEATELIMDRFNVEQHLGTLFGVLRCALATASFELKNDSKLSANYNYLAQNQTLPHNQ